MLKYRLLKKEGISSRQFSNTHRTEAVAFEVLKDVKVFGKMILCDAIS